MLTKIDRNAKRTMPALLVAMALLGMVLLPYGTAGAGAPALEHQVLADGSIIEGHIAASSVLVPEGAVVHAIGNVMMLGVDEIVLDGTLVGDAGATLTLVSDHAIRIRGELAGRDGGPRVDHGPVPMIPAQDGGSLHLMVRGENGLVHIAPGATVMSGDGEAGRDIVVDGAGPGNVEPVVSVLAGHGANGGNIRIDAPEARIDGTIQAGAGGHGGLARVDLGDDAVPGQAARAVAGDGGLGGTFALFGARTGITTATEAWYGAGGNGGEATAYASDGAVPGPIGPTSTTGSASAVCGTDGGHGQPVQDPVGGGHPPAGSSGESGDSGNADASDDHALHSGADGGDGCSPGANGGNGGAGGWAEAYGGHGADGCSPGFGGHAFAAAGYGGAGGDGADGQDGRDGTLLGLINVLEGGDGQSGGSGGHGGRGAQAAAWGGNGGDNTCSPIRYQGAAAGSAHAYGGDGGDGGSPGYGGDGGNGCPPGEGGPGGVGGAGGRGGSAQGAAGLPGSGNPDGTSASTHILAGSTGRDRHDHENDPIVYAGQDGHCPV